MTRRAADLLVDCLVAHGVDRVFCVPGESYLAVLDALVNALQDLGAQLGCSAVRGIVHGRQTALAGELSAAGHALEASLFSRTVAPAAAAPSGGFTLPLSPPPPWKRKRPLQRSGSASAKRMPYSTPSTPPRWPITHL